MDPTPIATQGQPAATGRWRRLWLRVVLVVLGTPLLLAVLALVAAAGFAAWSVASEAGNRWWLHRAPGLSVQAVEGTLWEAMRGKPWVARGLRWQADPPPAATGPKPDPLWVEFDRLELHGLRWQWRPDGDTWLSLELDRVATDRLRVHTGPPSTVFPRPLPQTLAFPVRVAAKAVTLDRIDISGLDPLAGVAAQGVLWQSRPGGQHRIEALAGSGFGLVARGRVAIANTAPYALEAQLDLGPAAAPAGSESRLPPWNATVQARGPLAEIALEAQLQSVATAPGRGTPQRLELSALARPLQQWPVARLDAKAQALDIAALAGGVWVEAPQTRLSGTVRLAAASATAPVQIEAELDNSLPGRWDQRRLPLAKLRASARGSLQERDRVRFERLELALADTSGSAGRVDVQAQVLWGSERAVELEARLSELAPHRLDLRAAAMKLSGPLALTWAQAGPNTAWQMDLRSSLQGQLALAPQPVSVQIDARLEPRRVLLRQFVATAGAARAELSGRFDGALGDRPLAAPWQASSQGRIEHFDPVPWWPGAEGAAWRRGPHRLNAQWAFDLRGAGGLPTAPKGAATPGGAWLAWAQRLAGSGRLAWADSQLAGVATRGELTLGYARSTGGQPGTPSTAPAATLTGDLTLGGNRLRLTGQGDPTGAGASDRIAFTLDAPQLANLKPLAPLHPALAEWLPQAGSVLAEAELLGRWPDLRSSGRARVQGLKAGTGSGAIGLQQGQLDWRVDLGAVTTAGAQSAPLALALDATGLLAQGRRLDTLQARLDGTLAEHRLGATSSLPYTPAPAVQQMLGLPLDERSTRVELQGKGSWLPQAGGGGTWRGALERLAVGGGGGGSSSAPWLETGALRAELGFGTDGAWQWLRMDPGWLVLGNTLRLRWDEIQARLQGEHVHWGMRADLESFAVAPLLTRTQPGIGWGGDLRLAGRIVLDAREKFEADVRVERLDGDLTVNRGEGLQLLGLADLQLRLSARDGNWSFSPRLRSRGLGEIDGSLLVRTDAALRWPAPEAALQGAIEARVRDIGIWSPWVPPGWRLAGEVQTQFRVGGRFSEPNYVGELTGQGIAVRHLLQGINVSDGEVRLKLDGDRAVIERFVLKGGEGTLELSGDATLPIGARAERPREPVARIVARAERFRVIGRVDRLLTASGDATLRVQGEKMALNAQMRVDEGQIDISGKDAPSLDDDVVVRSGASGGSGSSRSDTEPVAGSGSAGPGAGHETVSHLLRNFALDAQVDLGERLQLKGRGLETELRGKLRFTAPGGQLAINGSVFTDKGTYAAYAQKLEVARGELTFTGPRDNPRLDILALRPNLDVRVGVQITGSAQSPRVRLVSEPEMGEQEKLSWLMLGRASDGLGRNDLALLQRAAVALLAGEGEAPTDQLLRNLGIDELSLSQREGDVRDTVITIGKNLGRRWYLGYERGVNATAGTWQLTYRVAQRFTVRAQSGLDSSLDLIWVRRFGDTDETRMRKSVAVPP